MLSGTRSVSQMKGESRDIPDLQCPGPQYSRSLVLGQVRGGYSDFIWLSFALQARGSRLLGQLLLSVCHFLVMIRTIDTVGMRNLAIGVFPLLLSLFTLWELIR